MTGSLLSGRSYAHYCLLAGFLLTAGASLLSVGVYHEDDLKHYLYAHWSWHDAHYLLDEWGRPGFTIPYALPAGIGSAATGWHACRLLSVFLTTATAWLSYRIALQLNLRHAWLAIPLFYFQPLVTHLSLTTLTETPLAFYLALALWLLLTKRPTASAAVIALAPLTRHEAIILLVIWIPALWQAHAKLYSYLTLFWALITHNVLSAIFLDTIPVLAYFEADGSSQYGSGTLLSFVPAVMFAAGPLIVSLAIVGAGRLLKRSFGWLIVTTPVVYFLTHTLIYMFGCYSTGGYARFLVPISPFVAILAITGAGYLLSRRPVIRRQAVWAVGNICIQLWLLCEIEWQLRPPELSQQWHDLVTLARITIACWVVLCLISLYRIRDDTTFCRRIIPKRLLTVTAIIIMLAGPLWAMVPLRLTPQQKAIQQAADVLTQPSWSDRPLITINYWVYYFSDRWVPQEDCTFPHDGSLSQSLAQAEPGTLLLWDARFCTEADYNLSFPCMRNQFDWYEIWVDRLKISADAPLVVIFEKITTKQ